MTPTEPRPLLLVPRPRGAWTDASVIATPAGKRFLNDFSLLEDAGGRWHCFAYCCDENGTGDDVVLHYVADELTGPYREVAPVASGSDGPVSMWPAFAIRDPRGGALLFYSHHVGPIHARTETSIRVLRSVDPDLALWEPLDLGRSGDNIVFAEPYVRDPCIIWDSAGSRYLFYYVAGDGWVDAESVCSVRVRESRDLRSWSEPRTLMPPPAGYRAAESIFVLEHGGLFHLWVCGFDYGRMSLYISEDPLDFGDVVRNRIVEQPGHAPEIVEWRGEHWMACAAIVTGFEESSDAVPPNGFVDIDLHGIRVQPLDWRPASAGEPSRVTRRH